MTDLAQNTDPPVRPLTLFGIAITGVFASAGLGAITTAVNGWVSPVYFVTILGWSGVENVWRASIAQGTFEGLIFGVFFSLLFTAGVGIMTRASCGYWFAARRLIGIVAGAFMFWLIGGVAAMGLASFSPEFYYRGSVGVPDGFGPMLAHAWVRGSIWGVELGGLVSVVLGLVVLRGNLRRSQTDAQTPNQSARQTGGA